MPTYTVKSSSSIEDGIHTGKIVGIQDNEREGTNKQGKKEKFAYTDIILKIDGGEQEIKYSCPTPKGTLNPKSKIGKVLSLFVVLENDGQIDPEKTLIGKEIIFQTTTNDGGYSEVLEKTIKKK